MTGPERAARDGVLREVADELAVLVLDDLLPLAHRLQAERARGLGLTMPELACLDTLRRSGPLTHDVLAARTGLGRSAVSKMVRRLEAAGHVERSATSSHLQALEVRSVRHAERDAQLDRITFELGAALWGAAADAGLDRPRRLAGVASVLHAITGCLHRVASDAAVRRDAQRTRRSRSGPAWWEA